MEFSPGTHEALPSVCRSSGCSAGQRLKAQMSLWPLTLLDSSYVQLTLEVPQSYEGQQPVQTVPFHFFRGNGCATQTSSSHEELQGQAQFSHVPWFA